MIWSQFSTKVLQVAILDINDINKCQYSKENSSLEQNLSLNNQIHVFDCIIVYMIVYIHDIINPK